MVRASNSSGLSELHFALTAETQGLALEALFPDRARDAEERGFIGLVNSGNGRRRRTLFLRKLVSQDPGWVTWSRRGLVFSHKYFSRALDEVATGPRGTGLLVVHSHLGTSCLWQTPRPSLPDLEGERDLLWHQARALPEGTPLAAGIMAPSGAWRVREYRWRRPSTAQEAKSRRFGPASGQHQDISAVRIVGPTRLELHHTGLNPTNGTAGEEIESAALIWGTEGQTRLGRIRVGIAGLGGVGSILAEYAARLGVGELVLVDYDEVKRVNLNRAVGATRSDVGRPKVAYCARIARSAAVSKSFAVTPIVGSTEEEGGIRPLLDCDVILNACDDPAGRQVLDHAAYAYLIPVIDGGTTLFVGNATSETLGRSQVSGAGPGLPCLECTGIYTREEASIARERPDARGPNAYLRPLSPSVAALLPRAPSVVTSNGLVASLMLMRLQRIILGFPPADRTSQQSYYVEQGELLWGPDRDGCNAACYKASLIALGDSHTLPTGVDLNRATR